MAIVFFLNNTPFIEHNEDNIKDALTTVNDVFTITTVQVINSTINTEQIFLSFYHQFAWLKKVWIEKK